MPTGAAEIRVLSTQATEEAYRELVPEFEKTTGHKVTTTFTGTLDTTSGWSRERATTS
jgi:molybdate transport system substrate-binding protein